AEGAVGRGVAVTADDEQSRQGQSLLGADHMDDALARIAQSEQRDTALGRIAFEIAHHRRQFGIGDACGTIARRHVMVGDAERQIRLGNRTATCLHLAEGVERAFMDVMAIYPEQGSTVFAARDLVRRPEPIDQSLWLTHRGARPPRFTRLVERSRYCMLKNTK